MTKQMQSFCLRKQNESEITILGDPGKGKWPVTTNRTQDGEGRWGRGAGDTKIGEAEGC